MDRNPLRLAFITLLVVTVATGCASTSRAGARSSPASSSASSPPPVREKSAPPSRPSPAEAGVEEDAASVEVAKPAPELTVEEEGVAVPAAERSMIELDAVRFPYDSARLNAEARYQLRELAAHLRSHRHLTVTVEGHCDERGTEAYNLALGHLRADAMKSFLMDHGVEEDRVRAVSYGEERPAVYEEGPKAWAQNRRGEMLLTAEGEATAGVTPTR